MSFRDTLAELNPDALFADGFDDAYVGFIDNHWAVGLPVAVYSRRKCIKILMQDMGEEAAEEFFEFNVAGAYVGPHTPLFLVDRCDDDDSDVFPS
jgi:hypothetical protein